MTSERAKRTVRSRHVVRAMLARWKADEKRLEELFGPYDHNDFSDGAEMQRNLGSAIGAACGYLAKPPADA